MSKSNPQQATSRQNSVAQRSAQELTESFDQLHLTDPESIIERRRVRFLRQGNYATVYAYETAERVRKMEERRERRRQQRRALMEMKNALCLQGKPQPILVDELDMKGALDSKTFCGSMNSYLYPMELTLFQMDFPLREPTVHYCETTRRPFIYNRDGDKVYM